MNPYVNEEIMWQRLKDTQREAENRRLYGGIGGLDLIRLFAKRAWLLAGLSMRRAPRPARAGRRPARSRLA